MQSGYRIVVNKNIQLYQPGCQNFPSIMEKFESNISSLTKVAFKKTWTRSSISQKNRNSMGHDLSSDRSIPLIVSDEIALDSVIFSSILSQSQSFLLGSGDKIHSLLSPLGVFHILNGFLIHTPPLLSYYISSPCYLIFFPLIVFLVV